MQFHIPQYIDIEDKLFGPLTLKQAIYVAGGIAGAYFIYRLIPWIFISAPIIFGLGFLTWALAFYPKEKLGKPFIGILEAGFNYYIGSKLYTWKKTTKETSRSTGQGLPSQTPQGPASVSLGNLSNKSLGLDVGGGSPTVEPRGKQL